MRTVILTLTRATERGPRGDPDHEAGNDGDDARPDGFEVEAQQHTVREKRAGYAASPQD